MGRVIWFVVLFGVLLGQEEPKTPPKVPSSPKKEVKVRVVLKDTTSVLGIIEIDKFVVETAYGTLEIPPREMRRVTVGKKADAELVERLRMLIRQLGSDDFKKREEARKELKRFGAAAITDLKRALESDDAEIRKAAAELLDELEKQFSSEEILPDDDIVETARFTIIGALKTDKFKVKTRYGTLEVPKKDILRIEFFTGKEIVRTIELRGEFAGTGAMFDTGIELTSGTEVEVTATGTMTSQQGFTFGPDGISQNMLPMRWLRGPLRNEPFGVLLGRIGRSGTPFKIGARKRIKVKKPGRLFLSFNANPQYGPYRGTFKVKIRVKK